MSRRSPVQILGTLALVPLPGCMAGAGVGAGKGGRLMAKGLGQGFPTLPTLPARKWDVWKAHCQVLEVAGKVRRAGVGSIRSPDTGRRIGEGPPILEISKELPGTLMLSCQVT